VSLRALSRSQAMFADKKFLIAVEESFRMYKKYRARSTAKLKPIHWYIATVLNSIWGNDFEVHCLGNNAKTDVRNHSVAFYSVSLFIF
jgi:hypothetical protein